MRKLLIVVLMAVGCGEVVQPMPWGAEPMNPVPAEYAGWWAEVETCSGLSRPFRDIQWFHVEQIGPFVAGRFLSPDIIVMTDAKVLSKPFTTHEMLHALGVSGHPEEYFVEKCGEIVAH